jgi:hypothetical protein
MVERSLSMREVWRSILHFSTFTSLVKRERVFLCMPPVRMKDKGVMLEVSTFFVRCARYIVLRFLVRKYILTRFSKANIIFLFHSMGSSNSYLKSIVGFVFKSGLTHVSVILKRGLTSRIKIIISSVLGSLLSPFVLKSKIELLFDLTF